MFEFKDVCWIHQDLYCTKIYIPFLWTSQDWLEFHCPFSGPKLNKSITLWLFNIAMENGPFIDDFPIEPSIYKGFSMAMLNNQMVNTKPRFPRGIPYWEHRIKFWICWTFLVRMRWSTGTLGLWSKWIFFWVGSTDISAMLQIFLYFIVCHFLNRYLIRFLTSI